MASSLPNMETTSVLETQQEPVAHGLPATSTPPATPTLSPVPSPETSVPPDLGGLSVAPELWQLDEAQLSSVRDLQIGREGVGHVTFHGITDCRGLLPQLQDILVVAQGEVVVYPDPFKKPPVGHGLNRPASVVLFNCLPTAHTRLSDAKAQERYRQRVAQMTEDKGAIFEDYDCKDGTWKFRVEHF